MDLHGCLCVFLVGVDKFMVAIVMELLVYCFSFKIG